MQKQFSLNRAASRKQFSISWLAWLGALLSVAGSGLVAQAATVTLTPSQDNSIYSESDNSNALGGLFAGKTAAGNLRRALLKFNIASIPAGSIIDSVSLALTQTRIGPAGSADFELHPVAAAWGVGTSTGTGTGGSPTTGDATWNYRLYNTSSWTSPGGDFGATSGTITIGTANTVYTFLTQAGLVADVQNWLNTPASNFGWILKAADESSSTTAREFGSMESISSLQPTLTVSYSAPPPVAPTLSNLTSTNSQLSFTFNAESNRTYTVQTLASFSSTNWSTFTNFATSPVETNRVVTDVVSSSNKFYRVKTP